MSRVLGRFSSGWLTKQRERRLSRDYRETWRKSRRQARAFRNSAIFHWLERLLEAGLTAATWESPSDNSSSKGLRARNGCRRHLSPRPFRPEIIKFPKLITPRCNYNSDDIHPWTPDLPLFVVRGRLNAPWGLTRSFPRDAATLLFQINNFTRRVIRSSTVYCLSRCVTVRFPLSDEFEVEKGAERVTKVKAKARKVTRGERGVEIARALCHGNRVSPRAEHPFDILLFLPVKLVNRELVTRNTEVRLNRFICVLGSVSPKLSYSLIDPKCDWLNPCVGADWWTVSQRKFTFYEQV